MKAIIAGAPVHIEGDPTEIAALVELLVGGKVLIEHTHTWRIGEPEAGKELVAGVCWCGETKEFQAWPQGRQSPPTISSKRPTFDGPKTEAQKQPNVGAVKRGNKPKGAGCPDCGQDRRSKIHQQRCKANAA